MLELRATVGYVQTPPIHYTVSSGEQPTIDKIYIQEAKTQLAYDEGFSSDVLRMELVV